MKTKLSAQALANTARGEVASIDNGDRRTIAQIIDNWNICVAQAGFTGSFDFPTTGYTRKAQLWSDLREVARQLDRFEESDLSKYRIDDIEAARYEAHLANIGLDALRRVHLYPETVVNPYEAHTEASQWNDFLNSFDGYVKEECMIDFVHAEALEMNRLWDIRNESTKAARLAAETGFPVKHCDMELEAEEDDYFAARDRLRVTVQMAHAEALHMEAERAEKAAEAIAPAHALAVLMNNHMETLPVAQVMAIFAQNPVLAAHLKCRQISALVRGADNNGFAMTDRKYTHHYAAAYRAEGLEMGFSYDFLLEHARKALFAFSTATRQLRAIRTEAAELNAHIEAFLPNAPERKVLTAYAASIK